MNDKNNTTLSVADLESNPSHAPVAEKETEGLDTRVDITVTSYRKRIHDPDGISVKASLDGIVRAGLLPDDSTKEVRQVTFKSIICKKDEAEKTVIEIKEKTNV